MVGLIITSHTKIIRPCALVERRNKDELVRSAFLKKFLTEVIGYVEIGP